MKDQLLYEYRQMPIWMSSLIAICISLGCIVNLTTSERTEIFNPHTWQYFIYDLPLHGWLVLALVQVISLLMIQMKICITDQEIYMKSMMFHLKTFATKKHLQSLHLYSAFAAKSTFLKPLFGAKNLSLEEKWNKSMIGFVHEPAFIKRYGLSYIDLTLIPASDVRNIVEILQRHWGLDTTTFLAPEERLKVLRHLK